MKLGDFLRDHSAACAPWNCSTAPADWCMTLGHPDFAAAWRGITEPTECDRVAAAGLGALWERGIGDALPWIDAPEAGDIAVLSIAGTEVGAIFTGERWAIRRQRGFAFLPPSAVTMLAGWRP